MKTEPRIQPHPVSQPARRILILHHRALRQLVAIHRRCAANPAPTRIAKSKRTEVTA